jgi:alternate signal-mediated exported protein
MNKSIKGAIAAGGAAVLLLGGAGTLSYWFDSGDATGGSLESGHLSLDNDTCAPWSLDDAEGTSVFDPDNDLIVPGDVLYRTCTFDIVASGEHLRAALALEAPSATGANNLTAALVLDADFTVGGLTITEITAANNADVLEVVESVTFPFGVAVDNNTQDLSALIEDISITATQVHD